VKSSATWTTRRSPRIESCEGIPRSRRASRAASGRGRHDAPLRAGEASRGKLYGTSTSDGRDRRVRGRARIVTERVIVTAEPSRAADLRAAREGWAHLIAKYLDGRRYDQRPEARRNPRGAGSGTKRGTRPDGWAGRVLGNGRPQVGVSFKNRLSAGAVAEAKRATARASASSEKLWAQSRRQQGGRQRNLRARTERGQASGRRARNGG